MTRPLQSRPLFNLDKMKDIKTGLSSPPLPDPAAADEIGERLGFGDVSSSRNPAHDLQDKAEQAIAQQRAPVVNPILPSRLNTLVPPQAARAVPSEPAEPAPARDRVSLQRRLAEASDLVGIRIPVADANRFKLFAARHRLTAGEALTYLLEASGIQPDGSLPD